jgi:hypothetical protein
MKKLVFLLILITIGCYNMGNQRIDYNHEKTYTITLNNAVGPTTSLTLRTLDNASPNDTNAIWLAMNGSDAAAGTQAAPVLTLEKAIDLLQAGSPTKTTIHIFRNSYVGDLEFSITDEHTTDTIPSMILQVELGEIATINLEQSSNYISSTGSVKLNGLYLIEKTDRSSPGYVFYTTDDIYLTNCHLYNSVVTNDIKFYFYANGDFIVSNSILNGEDQSNSIGGYSDSGVLTITNSIFMNFSNYVIDLNNNVNNSIDHCIFYNNNYLLNASDSTAKCTLGNSIFYKNTSGVKLASATLPTITFTYSLYDIIPNYYFSSDLGSVSTDSNTIVGVEPLFFDETNEDFRLMDERRTAPNSTEHFLFTSQAVYNTDLGQTPSDDSRDLGPYNVSYSLDTNTWASHEFDNTYFNDRVAIERELRNYQSFIDYRGNFRRTYNGGWGKRTIRLPKAVLTSFEGTEESFDLSAMIETRGAKRWYPFGTDGLWSSSGALTQNSDGN